MGPITESKIGSYSYSCLMALVDPADGFSVLKNVTSILDPSDLVWGDGKGAEMEPHITVLYGLHETSSRPFIDICSRISPFSVLISGLSTFEGEEYDVLKLDVSSVELIELNAFIRNRFEHTNSFPDYHPHLTIGYVKKGKAVKYTDASFPTRLTISGFSFSSSSQTAGKVSIPCMDPNSKLSSRLLNNHN